MANEFTRRDFLRTGTLAGLGMAVGSAVFPGGTSAQSQSDAASMIGYNPGAKDLIKVGFVGIGNQGGGHVNNLLPERVKWAQRQIVKAGFPEPKGYTKGDLDFERMCAEEDLDLVYNSAPWRWHAPICLSAMENGKHAASEVNIALSVENCWKLVEVSEKTLFGEIMHGECGYLHDLRGLKIHPTVYQGMWRVHQSLKRNGNLYPTHGIGPMAWCMDINRGDAFDTLVSMTTKSIGLNEFADKKYAEAKSEKDKKFYSEWQNRKYALGDVNITLIKTKLGKTIICKHDTNLPRPYSRDFLVQGSKGLVRKYPTEKIHIEGLSKGHGWEDMKNYREKYEHPVWKAIREKAKGAGHGGMDFIEDYRLITALRKGISPDIDVYDSAAWSAIIPLSEKSIAEGNMPVKFPDFTRGKWKEPRQLGISNWIV